MPVTIFTRASALKAASFRVMRDSNYFQSGVIKTTGKIALTSLTLTACLLFTSCGTFNAASNLAKKSVKSVAKLVPDHIPLVPQRIPIAEVRQEDLKTMPTGAEKALAFEKKRNRRYFAFIPGFYKAPKLPTERGMSTEGSILPPLKRSTD